MVPINLGGPREDVVDGAMVREIDKRHNAVSFALKENAAVTDDDDDVVADAGDGVHLSARGGSTLP